MNQVNELGIAQFQESTDRFLYQLGGKDNNGRQVAKLANLAELTVEHLQCQPTKYSVISRISSYLVFIETRGVLSSFRSKTPSNVVSSSIHPKFCIQLARDSVSGYPNTVCNVN